MHPAQQTIQPTWVSIQGLRCQPHLEKQFDRYADIGGDVYKVADEMYVVARRDFNFSGPKPPRIVLSVAWSPSIHAIRGILQRNPQIEDLVRANPPQELLPSVECWNCSALLSKLNTGAFGPWSTSEVSVRANLYESVYLVRFGFYRFYYSSPLSKWDDEKPVMIGMTPWDPGWNLVS